MKLLGIALRERDTTPHHSEVWYDRRTRCWVVQLMTADGDQIGDAPYVHSRREAAQIAKSHSVEVRWL